MANSGVTLFLHDAIATHQLGVLLGRSLPIGSVVLLQGDLGSGKTTLVQGIGVGLGITALIVSPTFTLIQEYEEGRIPLYHFDLYRLDPLEVKALRPQDYWNGDDYPLGVVAIEWAERLLEPPTCYLHISLAHQPLARQLSEGRQALLTQVGESQFDLASLECNWQQHYQISQYP